MDDAARYEQLGLLTGLDGAARTERVELLHWLQTEHQMPDEALLRSTAAGTVLLLAAGRELGIAARFSANQVAAKTGLDVDTVLALTRVNGLPLPQSLDEPHYGDADLELNQSAAQLLAAGLRPDQLLGISRVLSRGLSQAADLMRQTVMELAIEPGVSERELAATYAASTRGLLPAVRPVLDQLLRVHLQNAVSDDIVTASEREAGALPGARDVAVAFADLVGFTKLGEELPPDELERVAERLVVLTAEVVEAPVRLIKSVGDAVLLVSPDPEALLDVTFDLLELVEQQDRDFPQARIGVAYGPAVARAGDWFGRPVNLASRITGVARAGSVVVDQATRDAVGDWDGAVWSFAGDRRLKGIASAVKLHRARRPSEHKHRKRSK